MNSHVRRIQQLWDDAHAPRAPDAPTVVSTFAGCGGSSLGYAAAGFRELLAVEFDKHAVECLRANFPGLKVWDRDIADLDGKTALELTGLRPGELDVLDGSPPCQGFSRTGRTFVAGNRDDRRNLLFLQFSRLIRAFNPLVFVMENVAGLVNGRMRLVFADVLRELRGCGYRVEARILDARYFDCAQMRRRVFFVGQRAGPDTGGLFPAPASSRLPVLKDALADVPPGGELKPLSPVQVKNWIETRRGNKHPARFNLKRQRWDRQANTVPKAAIDGLMHPDIARRLTARELGRIQTFPDCFDFPGRPIDAAARIGNAVPPMLMYHIARHLRQNVLDTPAAPRDD